MFYRPLWIVPCALAALSLPALAEDEKDAAKELEEKERIEAQEEEKKEQAKTSLAYEAVTLKGTLALNPIIEGETSNTAVGTFNTLKGEFQLKFEDMQLRKELLAKQNGKVVTFTGKLRNQNKYFVVIRLEAATQNKKPPQRASPGGL